MALLTQTLEGKQSPSLLLSSSYGNFVFCSFENYNEWQEINRGISSDVLSCQTVYKSAMIICVISGAKTLPSGRVNFEVWLTSRTCFCHACGQLVASDGNKLCYQLGSWISHWGCKQHWRFVFYENLTGSLVPTGESLFAYFATFA